MENNIDDCKYVYTHELGNLSLNRDKSKELSILHVNIRSIFKNFSALKVLLSKFRRAPELICLSETNIVLKDEKMLGKMIHDGGKDDQFIPSIDGYNFIRNDCQTTKGGSGIFVKSTLDYTMHNDLLLNVNNCENVWVEIKLKHSYFCL